MQRQTEFLLLLTSIPSTISKTVDTNYEQEASGNIPISALLQTHAQHKHAFSLDSSSSLSFASQIMNTTTEIGSKQAMVKNHYTKPPILTEGNLSLETARDYETACHNFFDTKEIDEEDQVHCVLVEIKDHCMCNWILG